MIALLAAMDRNRVIGQGGDLPWRLPNDLKYFRQKTTGHTIIMGRKTFEAIGRPLPNRHNVVLTRQPDSQFPDGISVIHDINTAFAWHNQHPAEELFIIGGEEIFKQFLPHADRLYITLVDAVFQGDAYFPDFAKTDWQLTAEEKGERDSQNPYEHYFRQYDRQGG